MCCEIIPKFDYSRVPNNRRATINFSSFLRRATLLIRVIAINFLGILRRIAIIRNFLKIPNNCNATHVLSRLMKMKSAFSLVEYLPGYNNLKGRTRSHQLSARRRHRPTSVFHRNEMAARASYWRIE